jgi:signal peptidase I
VDIDFPLVLSWAVLISGGIWALDALLLRPRRENRAVEVAAGGARAEEAEQIRQEPVLVEYARSFFPVLLVVLILRSFLAEPYQIPSESMVPALEVGDFVLVNKFAYGLRLPVLKTKIVDVGAPERGDIMVFVPPGDDRYFIKRVIGLPGDRIRYANRALTVNGERLPYEFVEELQQPTPSGVLRIRAYKETLDGRSQVIYRYPQIRLPAAQEWVVPEDGFFMMGDNRGRSEDSRRWGFAQEAQIVGKAVAIWMHKEPGWHLPTFSRNRWFDTDPEATP